MSGLAHSYIVNSLVEYTQDRSRKLLSRKGLLTVPRIHSKPAHGAFGHYGLTLRNSLQHGLLKAVLT